MPQEDYRRIAQSQATQPQSAQPVNLSSKDVSQADSPDQQMKIIDSKILIITVLVIAVFFIGVYFAIKLTATEESPVQAVQKQAQKTEQETTQEIQEPTPPIDLSYLLPQKSELPEGWAQDSTTIFGADFLDNPSLEASRGLIAGARRFFDNMGEESEMEVEIISYSANEGSSAKFAEMSQYYLSRNKDGKDHTLTFLPTIGDNTSVMVYMENDTASGEIFFRSVVLFSKKGYFGSIYLKGYRDEPIFIHSVATEMEKRINT